MKNIYESIFDDGWKTGYYDMKVFVADLKSWVVDKNYEHYLSAEAISVACSGKFAGKQLETLADLEKLYDEMDACGIDVSNIGLGVDKDSDMDPIVQVKVWNHILKHFEADAVWYENPSAWFSSTDKIFIGNDDVDEFLNKHDTWQSTLTNRAAIKKFFEICPFKVLQRLKPHDIKMIKYTMVPGGYSFGDACVAVCCDDDSLESKVILRCIGYPAENNPDIKAAFNKVKI